ncbi:UDP-N-acetylmuramoyl-tripeptide--D-alanyl-D-alanine ligase [Candidatus Giovannonibacteria bacterium]|nr:UDP-N-acetylmuramoyl-tripeptide--D-alanyl-D-alanine ligase [Candidatus Giovannonibacteria bacterium]
MKQFLKQIVILILALQGKLILKKYKPKIVAITGSVGKTSAKEAIAKVLESSFKVRASEKSYNSDFGVPLTIIGAKSGWDSPVMWMKAMLEGFRIFFTRVDYPEVLVLEVGADRPGDIKRIRGWMTPDVAVVTALAATPVHIEFFQNPEEVFEEKAELIKNLPKDNWAVLNLDDPNVRTIRGSTQANIKSFGYGDGLEARGSDYKIMLRKEGVRTVPEGIEFKAICEGSEVSIKIEGAFGKHQTYAALAAIAVGLVFKISLEDSARALSLYVAPPGRLRLIKGIKNSWILDDTYNSSPKAVEAGLETLSEIPAERKIAVLGDMLELGKYTITAHREIGKMLVGKVDMLYAVGLRAKFFIEGAIKGRFKKSEILSAPDSVSASGELEKLIKPGDLILIKGSQSIRMEKIVENIMAEPERASELLCRQEREWKDR